VRIVIVVEIAQRLPGRISHDETFGAFLHRPKAAGSGGRLAWRDNSANATGHYDLSPAKGASVTQSKTLKSVIFSVHNR
jgi:hypothetical protein